MNPSLFTLYLILGMISFIYTVAGLQKVFGKEPMKSNMREMNYARVAVFTIGILEIAGVIGIWILNIRPLALICLLPFAVGGLAAHITLRHKLKERGIPAILMIVLIITALIIDPSFSIVFH